MDEIWLEIPGYNYMVSDIGRIWSNKRNQYKKPIIVDGYYSILFGVKSFRVHRLVAQAFCHNTNPEKYTIVNHKDGNKINNNAKNLEWTDHSTNSKHAMKLRPQKYISIRGEVLQIKEGNIISTFKSARDAMRVTGLDSSSIYSVLNGKKESFGGFVWKYKRNIEEPEGKIFEDYTTYIITKDGRVYSKYKKDYLCGRKMFAGYIIVNFKQHGMKTKGFLVHRLVAMVYLDNPSNLPSVNHKNGNKSDNRVENLEWVSAKQNSSHSINILKKGRIKSIEQYNLDGKLIGVFNSTVDASKNTGYKVHSIQKVARGERNSLFGFVWKFSV